MSPVQTTSQTMEYTTLRSVHLRSQLTADPLQHHDLIPLTKEKVVTKKTREGAATVPAGTGSQLLTKGHAKCLRLWA